MTRKKTKNDVAYYKPLSVCKKGTQLVGYRNRFGQWYNIHTKTKPIAYSTVATLNWLNILKKESKDWEEMLFKANGQGEYLKDEDASRIIQAYIDCNAPYNDVEFE